MIKANYIENIKILRQKIPVGVSDALRALKTTYGNVEEAENLIKKEFLSILIEKTDVDADIAQKALVKNKFDIGASLIEIEKQVYSSTELILKRCLREKEYAIESILKVIERKIEATIQKDQELWMYGWFNFELLKTLDSYLFSFAAIAEWLSFEDCEDFYSAIGFHTQEVTEQIEIALHLPEIADHIRVSNERSTYFYEKYKNKKNGYSIAYEKLIEDAAFKQAKEGYFNNKRLLINSLYEFVKTHINQFP
ncbi:hypothetical protein [Emticicia sp. C21]|uniref:hypothetical protein n=1 Tax=Emticicia sp. C21 TaxID=2302915 RepID=UPI000E3484A9|nr:hypothetical protein [Emticicia sp. C21]RFS17597.1 hypothetical protein D0T08_07460 [Emticicia sp. C21]